MTCASCVGRIETAAQSVPGTLSAEAFLPDKTLRVETMGDVATLRDALAQAGYPAKGEPAAPSADARQDVETRALFPRFVLAAVLTLPVFVVEMGGHIDPPLHHWIARSLGT